MVHSLAKNSSYGCLWKLYFGAKMFCASTRREAIVQNDQMVYKPKVNSHN